MAVQLIRGAAAEALLAEPPFLESWRRLWEACPWATAFQTDAFVSTWYRVYREIHEPVLVVDRSPDGRLSGLLALAVRRSDGAWHGAGIRQAEYQAWLAAPGDDGGFVERALRLVFAAGARRLSFLYLPAAAPLAWTEAAPWRGRVLVRRWSRPLMQLGDAGWLRKSLAKRGNKSRLKRLGRDAVVRLELVTGRDRLAAVIDCFASLCDFRHGAAHGTLPFHDDPLRAAFHLALMEHPGLLHASLLWSGERLLAAHLGLGDRGVLYNGLLTHSPFDARNSPGKLHVLLMGQRLSEDGYHCFDLTPGDDPWKERFANASEQVSEVVVYRSSLMRGLVAAALAVKAVTRRLLNRLGLEPTALRRSLAALWAGGWPAWRRRLGGLERLRVFELGTVRAPATGEPAAVAKDDLAPLVDYVDALRHRPVGFLAGALARLEQGQHFLSHGRAGRLDLLAWLIGDDLAADWSFATLGFRCPERTALVELEATASGEPEDAALDACIALGASSLRARGGTARVLVVVPAALRAAERTLRRQGAVPRGEVVRLMLPWTVRVSARIDLERGTG